MTKRITIYCLCIFFVFLSISAGLCEAVELPVAGILAGDYISAQSGTNGAKELSSYLYSSMIITVKPYTEHSRSKVTIYSTAISSPIIARRDFISYHEILMQKAPYVFTDSRGNTITFTLSDQGTPTGLDIAGDSYVPLTPGRTPLVINGTIFILQSLFYCSILAIAMLIIYYIKNRKQQWHSFIATRLNTCLTLVIIGTVVNNAVLLISSIDSLPYAQCTIHFVLNYAGLALMIGLSIAIICTWRRSELVKRQKAVYIVNMIAAATLITIIMFWQLYR